MLKGCLLRAEWGGIWWTLTSGLRLLLNFGSAISNLVYVGVVLIRVSIAVIKQDQNQLGEEGSCLATA